MSVKKWITTTVFAILAIITANAQTDYTSLITNPTKGASLRVGIKCTSAPASYWTMFDHFRLLFFGNSNTPDNIERVEPSLAGVRSTVYDLQGRKITNASGSQLRPGLYIVNGKKLLIRK